MTMACLSATVCLPAMRSRTM